VIPACFILILLLLYGALGSARDAAIVFTGVPFGMDRGRQAVKIDEPDQAECPRLA